MITNMICRTIETQLGLRQADDRDSLMFKRVDTPGDIISYVIKDAWRVMIMNLKKDVKRKDVEVARLL